MEISLKISVLILLLSCCVNGSPKLSLSSNDVTFGEEVNVTCENKGFSKFLVNIRIKIENANEAFSWNTEYDMAHIEYQRRKRSIILNRLRLPRRRAFFFKSGNFSLVVNRYPTYFMTLKLPVDGRIDGNITCRIEALEGTASVTTKVTVKDKEKHACPRSPHISMNEPIRPKPETKIPKKKQTVPQRKVNIISVRGRKLIIFKKLDQHLSGGKSHTSQTTVSQEEKQEEYSLGQDLRDLGKCVKKFLQREWLSVLLFINIILLFILLICLIPWRRCRKRCKDDRFIAESSEKLIKPDA